MKEKVLEVNIEGRKLIIKKGYEKANVELTEKRLRKDLNRINSKRILNGYFGFTLNQMAKMLDENNLPYEWKEEETFNPKNI